MSIIPIILAGGSGSRLWPLSHPKYPKQFLKLINKKTLLQQTLLRLKKIEDIHDVIIICNEDHRFLVIENCKEIGILDPIILLEPISKNTAPAITLAALQSLKIFNDAILLVLPSDHLIQNLDIFGKPIKNAKSQAQKGEIVTFGVIQKFASTEYGYIKISNLKTVSRVEKFIEKPKLEITEAFFKDGNYLWNSGIFMFKACTINELEKYYPELVSLSNDCLNNIDKDLNFIRLKKDKFEKLPSISIDIALMEKSKKIVVFPFDAGWSDLGSWSLYENSKKNKDGNVINGDVTTKDTSNSYIYSSDHMTVTFGLKDIIIINTPEATLITDRHKTNEISSLIKITQEKRTTKIFLIIKFIAHGDGIK